MNSIHASGRFQFTIPNNLEGCGVTGPVIFFPDEPAKWVEDMNAAAHSEVMGDGGIDVVIEMIGDGGGVSEITFCPDGEILERDKGINTFSFMLSSQALEQLGQALIAAARINRPLPTFGARS